VRGDNQQTCEPGGRAAAAGAAGVPRPKPSFCRSSSRSMDCSISAGAAPHASALCRMLTALAWLPAQRGRFLRARQCQPALDIFCQLIVASFRTVALCLCAAVTLGKFVVLQQ